MASVKLIDLHFWVHTIGVVLYAASMWIAGIGQGLMARASNADGTLTYAFVEIVKFNYPYYMIRFIGGVLVVAGMVMMVVNMWRTFQQAKGLVDAPVLPAATEASHA
jgi:cytochrome c oxidase cbb3-type subunit 1